MVIKIAATDPRIPAIKTTAPMIPIKVERLLDLLKLSKNAMPDSVKQIAVVSAILPGCGFGKST